MLELAVEAIEQAGYSAGTDVFLGIDVASTHFYKNGQYHKDGEIFDSEGMIQIITKWLDRYPILSVEDGLAEDDWNNWPALKKAIAGRALTLGDDLLCTNPARIQHAVATKACDALLLKVNQIGTLTEAIDAYKQARAAGWSVTLSVRSGETEDNWAADLAVGWRADQFKNGSIRQSERLAKYNRLLDIEGVTHWPLAAWPGRI
jgi:enolase